MKSQFKFKHQSKRQLFKQLNLQSKKLLLNKNPSRIKQDSKNLLKEAINDHQEETTEVEEDLEIIEVPEKTEVQERTEVLDNLDLKDNKKVKKEEDITQTDKDQTTDLKIKKMLQKDLILIHHLKEMLQ